MLKKVLPLFVGIACLFLIGGVIYADACGLFLENDEAAMKLIDRYMSSVMKFYNQGDEKISFRGIVKEGCDFWYYNDYNNKIIAQNHISGSGFEVEKTEYFIKYNKVDYSNKFYTIDATVTQEVYYKNYPEAVTYTSSHTFKIEQDGNNMYIVDDVTDVKGDILLPDDVRDILILESGDFPVRSELYP